jgi:hypothetical protein
MTRLASTADLLPYMVRPAIPSLPSAWPRHVSFDDRLREIGMFFQGNDPVHRTMHRVADALEAANIPYAIVGGMAVNAHNHRRTTGDVDFLLTTSGFEAFRRLVLSGDFERVPGRPRRFFDSATGVTFDILITGLFPGSGKPGPFPFPDPSDVSVAIGGRRVVNLATLIQLKLAATRHQDFADVVNLIRVHDLAESFLAHLHPSVHRDFIECLEEERREDEYEARQDEAVERHDKEEGPQPPSGP